MLVPISQFVITSDFRAEREEIGELAHSINSTGLIQPIVVDKTEDGLYNIIAGRRRFSALRDFIQLPFLEINKHFIIREGIDPMVAQFEENFRRRDFKPLEVANLVSAIHTEKVKEHGHAIQGDGKQGWGLADTANLIGKDKSFVSRLIQIAKHPDLVKNCETLKEALEIVSKEKGNKIVKKVREERVKREVKKLDGTDLGRYIGNLMLSSAQEYLKTLENESIDLVYCDPPFGLDIDEIAGSANYEAYEDDPGVLIDLIEEIVPEYFRVLKNNRFAIVWTSFEFFTFVKEKMEDAGFRVAPVPLIWVKTNTTGKSIDPNKTFGSIAEIAVYGWKGNESELTVKGRSNVFPYETVRKDRIHVAQKPESMIIDHLNIFSTPGAKVLDTFSGSGATLRACFIAGRDFYGCEMKEDHYNRSIIYTKEWVMNQDK